MARIEGSAIRMRLYVPPYVVRLNLDRNSGVLVVAWVFRQSSSAPYPPLAHATSRSMNIPGSTRAGWHWLRSPRTSNVDRFASPSTSPWVAAVRWGPHPQARCRRWQ